MKKIANITPAELETLKTMGSVTLEVVVTVGGTTETRTETITLENKNNYDLRVVLEESLHDVTLDGTSVVSGGVAEFRTMSFVCDMQDGTQKTLKIVGSLT